ncbi:MAG: DUF1292 domain-containing protein [Clostridiales bacterium]|nr:DUF1292 domain-containing protein [Clostridiales bacterium]
MVDERTNSEVDENTITLVFDDGIEEECEIMGVFEVEDKEYVAVAPDNGTDDVYIYRYKEVDEDSFEIIDIEDDAEFEKAVAEFDDIMSEEE